MILLKNIFKKILGHERVSDSFSVISEHFIFYRTEYVEEFDQIYPVFKKYYFEFIKSIKQKNIKKLRSLYQDENYLQHFHYLILSIRSFLVRKNYLPKKIELKDYEEKSFYLIEKAIEEFIIESII